MNHYHQHQTIKYAGNTSAPRKGSPMAAGHDLTADKDYSLGPGDRTRIGTGLYLAIPAGWFGKVEGRSGLAFNHGILCFGGVIDADYRGEIKVLLANTERDTSFHIKKGDRVAQIVIQPHWHGIFEHKQQLSPTARGQCGFGSTGIKSEDGKRQATLTEMWQMPDGRSPEQLNQELAGLSAWDRYGSGDSKGKTHH
jgi:dUTP pyrophosphatase